MAHFYRWCLMIHHMPPSVVKALSATEQAFLRAVWVYELELESENKS